MDGELVELNYAQQRSRCVPPWLRYVAVTAVALSVCACGDGDDEGGSPPPRLAVLSAFPAEMAAVLAQATIDETVELNGRMIRLGKLGGVPVVIGMTGIGLVNAAATTRAVLDRFAVAGVVVSAVAGSTLRIGDVTVPTAWTFNDGTSFPANQQWLDLARAVAASGTVAFDSCTVVPSHSPDPVCLSQAPVVAVGGIGRSSDPFGGQALPCQPNGGDLYGCDVVTNVTTSEVALVHGPAETEVEAAAEAPIANDMETAAIAREAAARGLPFIAFRAVSDGAGDPLGIRGFPAQFVAYYRLAAHNAAAATVAFLERLAAGASG